MSVLSKGTTFATGDQVTATNLNNHVDNATFAAGAVDNSTTQLSGGAIIVKDGGITSAKLATNIAVAGTLSSGGSASLGLTGTQDYLKVSGQMASLGAQLASLTYDQSDYAPLALIGYPLNLYARTTAGASTLIGIVSSTGLAVTGLTTTDTLRINTAPSASVATASTHKVAVNLNGSTYYLLCTT